MKKHAEALAQARQSIEAFRGVLGREPDLVASLHLAAFEAKADGRLGESAGLKAEAALIERIAQPIGPRFASRISALFTEFDAEECAAIERDATAIGFYGAVAAAQVAKAVKSPNLSENERTALLESGANTARKKGDLESEKRLSFRTRETSRRTWTSRSSGTSLSRRYRERSVLSGSS